MDYYGELDEYYNDDSDAVGSGDDEVDVDEVDIVLGGVGNRPQFEGIEEEENIIKDSEVEIHDTENLDDDDNTPALEHHIINNISESSIDPEVLGAIKTSLGTTSKYEFVRVFSEMYHQVRSGADSLVIGSTESNPTKIVVEHMRKRLVPFELIKLGYKFKFSEMEGIEYYLDFFKNDIKDQIECDD